MASLQGRLVSLLHVVALVSGSAALEEADLTFMILSSLAAMERSKVPALAAVESPLSLVRQLSDCHSHSTSYC